jgi:predicted transcriptional regulator
MGLARSEVPAVAETVESGLGSATKLKILRLMLQSPEHAFTLYELEQRVPVKPVSIRKHVTELKRLGWVKETPYMPRKLKANLCNDSVKHVLTFFETMGYI